jgi:hypothetical protein
MNTIPFPFLRLPCLLFTTLCSLYLVQTSLLGRFPHIDEVAYKAAGFHWATDGTWAAPELVGLVDSPLGVDQFWAAYPPIYMAAFAGAVKLFGMGWRTCSMFDAGIHVLLAAATVGFSRSLGSTGWARWLPGVLVLPLGTLGRPDELAMVFGLVALSGPRPTTRGVLWQCLWQGVGIGLAALTSPGVGLAFAIVLATRVLVGPANFPDVTIALGGTGVVAFLTVLLVFVPVLLQQPGALDQFLAHASGYGGGLTWEGLAFSWRCGKWLCLCIAGLISAGGLALLIGPRRTCVRGCAGVRCLAGWWAGGLAASLWVLFSSPYRQAYFWFVGPVLVVVAVRCVQQLNRSSARRLAGGVTALVASATVGAVPLLTQSYFLWTLPSSQTWRHNEPLLRRTIPAGSVVTTSFHWWSLAGHSETLDIRFAYPRDWHRITHVVQTGTGSGAVGRPLALQPGLDTEVRQWFHVSVNNLNTRPQTFAGYQLTDSGWGFGAIVWERHTGP